MFSSIGDGAFIGAGSVVQNDVPPYAVVTGNPARVVRYRFSPAKIQELLASRWWNKSIDELSYDMDSFRGPLEEKAMAAAALNCRAYQPTRSNAKQVQLKVSLSSTVCAIRRLCLPLQASWKRRAAFSAEEICDSERRWSRVLGNDPRDPRRFYRN